MCHPPRSAFSHSLFVLFLHLSPFPQRCYLSIKFDLFSRRPVPRRNGWPGSCSFLTLFFQGHISLLTQLVSLCFTLSYIIFCWWPRVLFDFGSYLLFLSTSHTANTGREFLCQTRVERARKKKKDKRNWLHYARVWLSQGTERWERNVAGNFTKGNRSRLNCTHCAPVYSFPHKHLSGIENSISQFFFCNIIHGQGILDLLQHPPGQILIVHSLSYR